MAVLPIEVHFISVKANIVHTLCPIIFHLNWIWVKLTSLQINLSTFLLEELLCCNRFSNTITEKIWALVVKAFMVHEFAHCLFIDHIFLVCCQGASHGIVRRKQRFQSASVYLKPYEDSTKMDVCQRQT